jgi:hypothetical protein
LIRDFLSYELYGKLVGKLSHLEVYIGEVVVNGDYKGLYIFMEKLKVDEGRESIIVKMATTDICGTDVTGWIHYQCAINYRGRTLLRGR